MSIEPLRPTAFCLLSIVLLALTSWPGEAATQDATAEVLPQNAHMKRYGGGWECD